MAPVLTNVLNECGACGSEIVGRKAVEALVTGVEKTYLGTENMRRRIYASGASFLYGSFHASKVSASYSFGANFDDMRGERFIRCECSGSELRGGPMVMVREEFREKLSQKLGGKLTFPLLFSLPPSMVAWENSGYVKLNQGPRGYELSEEGVALVDIIRDMSRTGVFDGGLPCLDASDVVDGYTYLYMVKPKYRAIVASDFGPRIGLGELLAKVPLGWVDWGSVLALRGEQKDGFVVLSRLVGMPLVAVLFSFYRDNKSPQLGGVYGGPVVPGVAVSTSGTHVQFMPQREEGRGLGSFKSPDCAVLAPGTVFLPSGRVTLRGAALAVTFEPGVVVETEEGTLIRNGRGGITIFLNGDIDIELHHGDCAGTADCSCGTVASETRVFTVAAVCDSYAEGTALRGWHHRRFDTGSTEARVFAGAAEFVVLCRQDYELDMDKRVIRRDRPRVGSSMGDGLGRVTCTVDTLHDGDPVCVSEENEVFSSVASGSHLRELWFNHSIRIGGSGRVGFTGSVVMTASLMECTSHALPWAATDRRWFANPTIELLYVEDAFLADGGGPSGSEDGYDDDDDDGIPTRLLGHLDAPLDVIERLVLEHRAGTERTMTHRVLGEDCQTLLFELGVAPRLVDVLGVDLRFIDLSVLKRTGMTWSDCGYLVVPGGNCQFTWRDILRVARSWGHSLGYGDTLMGHLLREYPDVAVEAALMKGGRCL